MTPAEKHRIVSEANAYRYARGRVADAERDRFQYQLKAWAAAPAVYKNRVWLQALEEVAGKLKLTIHPPGIEVRIDNSRTLSPDDLMLQKELVKQADKENK